MAEFCIDCFNGLNKTHYTPKDVVLEEDYCEGCGEEKDCVIQIKNWGSL